MIPEVAHEKVREVDAWIANTNIIPIADQASYSEAVGITNQIKLKKKEVETVRTSITDPLNAALKAANSFFKPAIERLELFERGIKATIGVWLNEQERKRIEEQRKAEEVARKERERIEEIARREREKEAEERKRAAEAKRAAAMVEDEQEKQRLENIAQKSMAKAESLCVSSDMRSSMASTIVAPQAAPVDKAGAYTVKTYALTVIDKAAFIRWCTESGQLEYLDVKENLLKKEAQASKGERRWPGVSVVVGSRAQTRI